MLTINTKQLLAPEDAARALKLSPDRIRQLAHGGILPAITLSNGRLVFAIEDVQELARQRCE